MPGFGIFGLGGGVLVLASLILASQTFVFPHNAYQFAQLQRSLLTIAGGRRRGSWSRPWLLRRWLPRAPIFNRCSSSRRPAKRPKISPPRVAGRLRRPGRHPRHDHHPVDAQRQGPLRQPAGRRDRRRRGDRPRREIEVVEVHGNRVVVDGVGEWRHRVSRHRRWPSALSRKCSWHDSVSAMADGTRSVPATMADGTGAC